MIVAPIRVGVRVMARVSVRVIVKVRSDRSLN